jgi:hypothetical protein
MNAVDKVGVVQAQQKCPKQLTDAFKLVFLRCECFHVEVR